MTTLPYVTPEIHPIQGQIRCHAEDFVVDEVPAYAPEGQGDHLFIRFEKRHLTTQDALRRIAQWLGSNPRDAGWAGLKDRNAVTTQWISVFKAQQTRALEETPPDGIRILETAYHRHKLRIGHLSANRFRIRIREVNPNEDANVNAILERVSKQGLPNYFGEQRFGTSSPETKSSLERATDWITGQWRGPRDRFQSKFLVSVFQSHLFNSFVARRMEEGAYLSPFEGDIMRKETTGGLFAVKREELEEARKRILDWEISPTGPMYGARMMWPEGEARAREQAFLVSEGFTEDHLHRFAKFGEGTRRTIRVRPQDVQAKREGTDLWIEFQLPSGSYATTLLREITKTESAPVYTRKSAVPQLDR